MKQTRGWSSDTWRRYGTAWLIVATIALFVFVITSIATANWRFLIFALPLIIFGYATGIVALMRSAPTVE